jgi:hypothetical protein
MTGGEKTQWTLSRRFLLGASVTSVAGLIASQRASPASVVKDDPNLPPYGNGAVMVARRVGMMHTTQTSANSVYST